jgi:hypothetical protein
VQIKTYWQDFINPPKILSKTRRPVKHTQNCTNSAPHISRQGASEKKMINGFIIGTKSAHITTNPFPFLHVVFSGNCIMPD